MLRIFVSGDNPAQAVREAGGLVQTDLGSIVTASIPLNQIDNLSVSPRVDLIRMGTRVFTMNDKASETVGADAVQAGESPLTGSYTGKGVVIGIIDTGIDFKHEDFKRADGSSRVLYLWDHNADPDGHAPSGPGFEYTYGREWTQADIDAGICTHRDEVGHGTHVAGTAAGNGRAIEAHKGMAPEADLIVVSITFESTTDILDAANYIYKRAEAMGKPVVINQSVGSQGGPHDGSSLYVSALDLLVAEKPGRVHCSSAGNSGAYDIHLTYPDSAVNDSLWTLYAPDDEGFITFYARMPSAIIEDIRFAVGYDLSDFNLADYSGGPQQYVERSEWYTMKAIADAADDGIYLRAEHEGKEIGFIGFYADRVEGDYTTMVIEVQDTFTWNADSSVSTDVELWRLMVWGGTPEVDIWLVTLSLPFNAAVDAAGYHKPDSDKTIGLPGVGKNIIASGAYVNRALWDSEDGNSYRFDPVVAPGALAAFSSIGPTADGRIKPDITAPGMGVISTKSADASARNTDLAVGGLHRVWSGTSMASPATAGCVALLLEKYPTAGYATIRRILRESVSKGYFTGYRLPDNKWGYGKVNVFNALTTTAVESEQLLPPEDFVLEPAYPNPFNPTTTVFYQIPKEAQVKLHVVDVLGRQKVKLFEGSQIAGSHRIQIDATGWSSGLYFVHFESGSVRKTQKILLVR